MIFVTKKVNIFCIYFYYLFFQISKDLIITKRCFMHLHLSGAFIHRAIYICY